MINIVIPMAGLGSRFAVAGFTKPKPFIDVQGIPMIQRVMENLMVSDCRFILLGNKSQLDSERLLVDRLERIGATIIEIDELTEGTACTVLHSRHIINNTDKLLIANSDQIVDISIQKMIDECIALGADGSILTFRDEKRNPKWSFAKIGPDGYVTEVREKQPISDIATVGIYLFARGKDFVDAAIEMMLRQDRVNNEYYTCPVYNYMIKLGMKIISHEIPNTAMHGLGTPEDLRKYEQLVASNTIKVIRQPRTI